MLRQTLEFIVRSFYVSRCLAGMALALALGACQHATPPSNQGLGVVSLLRPADSPPGANAFDVQWSAVEVADSGSVLMAVARPPGEGPFPALIVLHGTHGFAGQYVQLAKDLARGGIVVVAACWFAPGTGEGVRFVSALACPADAPPMPPHLSEQSRLTIDALVSAVRTLPGVRADRVALFGHSRGGGAAWHYVLEGGDVEAVVLNSAGYPDEAVGGAAAFDAPVLILHGETDNPADGGSPATSVARARAFEAALREAGKDVEAAYYQGGHNALFTSPSQYDAEVQRIERFLQQHLGG